MASTNFVNGVTLTDAAWFNDVDDVAYHILGDGSNIPATVQAARTNLSINSLTEETAPDNTTDFIEIYDSSLNASRKVLLGRARGAMYAEFATTSGTTVEVTGIPSWARRISVALRGVSTNSTSQIILQLGTGSGFETTNYDTWSMRAGATDTNNYAGNASASGWFLVETTAAATTHHGGFTIQCVDITNNAWTLWGVSSASASGNLTMVSGNKALSAALTQFRLNTAGGTASFDAGIISVIVE